LNSGKTIVAAYASALILNTFRVFAASILGLVAKAFTIVATTGDFVVVIAIFVVADLVTNSTTSSRHISVSKVQKLEKLPHTRRSEVVLIAKPSPIALVAERGAPKKEISGRIIVVLVLFDLQLTRVQRSNVLDQPVLLGIGLVAGYKAGGRIHKHTNVERYVEWRPK